MALQPIGLHTGIYQAFVTAAADWNDPLSEAGLSSYKWANCRLSRIQPLIELSKLSELDSAFDLKERKKERKLVLTLLKTNIVGKSLDLIYVT